ncbi:MAG: hypothetical protein WKF47_13820 [Geodermatophilaceae bacterium]
MTAGTTTSTVAAGVAAAATATGNRRGREGGDRFGGNEPDPTVSEDDVLIPVAGILDILDNYGFIRTSGYLTGPNDVYVSLSQVRKHGLRRGDAITGAVKQPRDGEKRGQVQRARSAGHRQRHGSRAGPAAAGVHEADPAVPAGAAAAGDRAGHPDARGSSTWSCRSARASGR